MNNYNFIGALFCALMITGAYAQEKQDSHVMKNITGTVLATDSVGNTITIQTPDLKSMAFFVPDKAIITQETHNIGLMDIGKSDAVTIQYFISLPSKSTVISIVDNESVVNE